MARQHTAFQNLRSSASAALAGLGIVILFVGLDGPAVLLTNLLGSVACKALDVLPYLLPAAWRALQAYAFDGQPSAPCPVQMLVSLWPLLHLAVGTV